jgi:dTDP-6-deoxy-L-talose 4-dehydrogenase (NAD+)
VKDLVNEWLKTNGWEVNLNLGFYPYPDYEPMSFWGLAPLDE